jgi:peptidoglycan biosynthesis protein MviN/MurJ (putative lipid II flippase)
MLRLASPTLMASIVIAVNPIVDKAIAARLEPGATTLIELGEKLFYIPMVLLVAAVAKVSATVWARQVDVDDEALRRDFWKVQRLGAGVTTLAVIVAVAIVVASRGLVDDLLDLGGDPTFFFVFAAYILGLPLALSADLAGTLLITLRRTAFFPALAVLLVVVNLVADLVGAHLFGVVGIAASSTIVRLVNVAVFLWLCDRHLRTRGADPPLPAPVAP